MTDTLADEIDRLVALTGSSSIADANQAAKDLGAIMFNKSAVLVAALRNSERMREALEKIAGDDNDGHMLTFVDGRWIITQEYARQALQGGGE